MEKWKLQILIHWDHFRAPSPRIIYVLKFPGRALRQMAWPRDISGKHQLVRNSVGMRVRGVTHTSVLCFLYARSGLETIHTSQWTAP